MTQRTYQIKTIVPIEVWELIQEHGDIGNIDTLVANLLKNHYRAKDRTR